MTTPRIYVACLAAYNNGKLHGEWIDANQDADDLWKAINAILAKSPEPGAEEWAIHDYEGFEGIELGENPDIAFVSKLAEIIDDKNGEVITRLHSHLGNAKTVDGLDETKEYFEEHYAGAFKSLEDWAYEFAMDTQGKDSLGSYASYIDWERVGRDAEIGGDVFTIDTDDGKTHVFWNR